MVLRQRISSQDAFELALGIKTGPGWTRLDSPQVNQWQKRSIQTQWGCNGPKNDDRGGDQRDCHGGIPQEFFFGGLACLRRLLLLLLFGRRRRWRHGCGQRFEEKEGNIATSNGKQRNSWRRVVVLVLVSSFAPNGITILWRSTTFTSRILHPARSFALSPTILVTGI